MTVFVRNFCIFFAQRISIYHQYVYTKYSFPQNALFFIYILSILVYNKLHHNYSMNQYHKTHIDSGEELFTNAAL